MDRYHNVAFAVEAGFGSNAVLSPSAWIRTTSDLLARILQGVRATRNFGPLGESLDQDDFKNLFNQEDWEAIQKNLTNLEHLSKIFPAPLYATDPPLFCGHCTHRTDPDADDRLTEADYRIVLMAADRSWEAVMGHLLNHLSGFIENETEAWKLDEIAKRRNPLRPRLQEDTELYYTQRCTQIRKEQDKRAEADSQEYCQGSEGPWRTTVLRDGSRVAERMPIRPSAYETSHDVTPVD